MAAKKPLVKEPRTATKPSSPDVDAQSRLQALAHDLVERIKELRCLYGISRLVEQKEKTLPEILQGVVELIPPAWQYPEVTCARITIRRKEYKTSNFRQTRWTQEETISVSQKPLGKLEVCYFEKMPLNYEGPFLKEERDLVHGIAERLGNIIESKSSEEKLRQLYARERLLHEKLQKEMQRRVNYTRLLVHEIKTPLTSLMATSQLLLDEVRSTRLERLAGYVYGGANNLNSRVEELHDLIRGEIGKLELKSKPLDIEKVLKSFVEETKALAEMYGLSVSLEIESSLPDLSADAERLRQILFNLFNNACKYASEGKKILLKAETGSESQLLISIKDFGPGISREKQRRLFRPGYEISAENSGPGGLGIGLTLCKLLVELHGGKIWLESQVGQGSTFFISLPAKRAEMKAGITKK